MKSFETFTELVLQRTSDLPTKDAFIFLHDNASSSDVERLTYAALDVEAKRIASWLQQHGASGGQVLLLYPSGLDFIKAFTACLYAGSVAVPAPLPGDQGNHFARVTGILRDAEVRAVLTDSANEPNISAWLREAGITDVAVLASDAADQGDAAAWTAPSLTPESLAFLQYTSGSTSTPKGVMVSHRNLLANELAIQHAIQGHQDTRLGGWLPFYHDMGLIGHILQPLYLGGSAALMSPISFLKRPLRWLQMITEHRVTAGGGPNFAYDLCLRRVTDEQLATLDLSSWEQACNGAEPIRPETVRAFTERFAPAGFRAEAFFPCYGMAETTLLVSGTPVGRAPIYREVDAETLEQGELSDASGAGVRTLVSSGVVTDFDVRIVDPETFVERPEGHVGEIWVKGESVAAGYWKRPEVNEEIFNAVLRPSADPEAAGDAGWLRTGDLGAFEAGELYVTGRLKEMILINGRNIYPHDVERQVQSLDPAFGVGGGAAFSVDDGEEHLVLVQEIRPNAASAADLPALLASARALISREFQVNGSLLLVRPGTIRKTTSGKIQRTLMRKLLLEGKLAPLHEQVEERVAAQIVSRVDAVLEPVG
ncbi:fatty acyl-AMP ligase [Streptacidiphilus rugosus]|uniref:fatty acyl-AMP ligase n=1 Tax=Streptacidiphilus rugosus TaxID=405783 RepID=UPI0005680216|nr:fatty acyl-AMP ligase [Streptacidiphilus rugosus]